MPMLNIVVPMAGHGSRFKTAGYELPKPLLPIHGVPMIALVVDNLRPTCEHRFIFVCLEEHILRHDVSSILRCVAPNCEVIQIGGVTEGAACTVLEAENIINSDDPLMIANSDQYLDVDINNYLRCAGMPGLDGLIMTMTASDPKWSYVRLGGTGDIVEVVEKQVVSEHATVGIYNFARGSDFVSAAREMINANLRVNNEFYVAPVYNQLIARGMSIQPYGIGSAGERMYGLGTPDDFEFFMRLELSHRATSNDRFERDSTAVL
jgi:NDP-sugar pyrophosphorylase family protein